MLYLCSVRSLTMFICDSDTMTLYFYKNLTRTAHTRVYFILYLRYA